MAFTMAYGYIYFTQFDTRLWLRGINFHSVTISLFSFWVFILIPS